MIYENRRGKALEVISLSPMPCIPVRIFPPRLLSSSRSLALSWGIHSRSHCHFNHCLLYRYAAVDILKESSRVLSDGVAIRTEEIEKVVLSIKGIKECHKVRSRGRPDDIHIDLHVLVDPEMDVHRAHHLSYAIENKIKRDFRGVTDAWFTWSRWKRKNKRRT